MWDFRIACITIVLILPFAAGISELEVRPRGPRDCTDVYLGGHQVEGNYALFPNDNNPDKAALVYCGVSEGMLPKNSSAPKIVAQNCQDLKDGGMTESGLNVIYPYTNHPETPVLVYCDQELMGGGWTVFQRRDNYDTQLGFYRSFHDYGLGFGNPGGEFWLGLDIIHELTQHNVNELYVDLTSFDDVNKYAHYKSFYVGPREPTAASMSDRPYYLSISHYSGNAGDSMTYSLGMGFSTYDADHDKWDDHCAIRYGGAWWYYNCFRANLNGIYYDDGEEHDAGVTWMTFSGASDDYQALRRVVMQVRPLKQQ